MVGDYTFDMLAGKRAGVKTALILNGKNHRVYRDHAHLIDFVLKSLRDLKRLIV
jgi:phosphoglycolate phosphatase-like HAD superfamily hydrolase